MKKILTNTFLVTLSFFVGNVFSYLLHIFLGRGLSVSEYAEFSVLLSLFNIFSVPATALSTTLTKQSSEFNAARKKEEVSRRHERATVPARTGIEPAARRVAGRA